jgi:hypothetical protein
VADRFFSRQVFSWIRLPPNPMSLSMGFRKEALECGGPRLAAGEDPAVLWLQIIR